jgi:hypothetical protein
MKKRFLLILLPVFLLFLFVSCNSKETPSNTNTENKIVEVKASNNNPQVIEVSSEEEVLSKLSLDVKRETNSETVNLEKKYLSDEDYESLATEGEKTITVDYFGHKVSLSFTLKYNAYLVQFVAHNRVYKSQTVDKGEDAQAPDIPLIQDGNNVLIFKAWDKDFKNVTKPLIVNALFDKGYSITYLDGDDFTSEYYRVGENPTKHTPKNLTIVEDGVEKVFTHYDKD